MPTYSALTTLPDEARAKALGEALEAINPEPTGVGVFEMEDGSGLWEVGAYFEEPPSEADLAILSAASISLSACSSMPPEVSEHAEQVSGITVLSLPVWR